MALFISCDEKKAKAELKKALNEAATETVVEANKGGTKSTLTKPAFSDKSVPWDTDIIFRKTAGYTYALRKTVPPRITLSGVTAKEAKNPASNPAMKITATHAAQNVIVVASFGGEEVASEPIEFTRKQGNTLSFADTSRKTIKRKSTTITQTASKSGAVAGDNRNIRYSIRT